MFQCIAIYAGFSVAFYTGTDDEISDISCSSVLLYAQVRLCTCDAVDGWAERAAQTALRTRVTEQH